jgi:hypothetical protein
MKHGSRMRRTWQAAGLLLLCCTAAAEGQEPERLLPAVRPFRAPVADPTAARVAVSLLSTDLLSSPGTERPPFVLGDPEGARRETVAAIALGGVLPVARLARWDDGSLRLVLDGRVFGRFRIEKPERDDMGQDWYIGFGVEGERGRWSGRALVTHRSSHLGDEFVVETGARRIEFGSEHVDVLVARDVAPLGRVYTGGSLIFRSYLGWDPWLREQELSDRGIVQAGLDREWRPWRDERWLVTAGVDVQAAERTDWRRQIAGAAGAGFRARESGRSVLLLIRAFDGPSHVGEFFLTRERYGSLELQVHF